MTKKNKGYSLVEMLIVIAIMAILAGLATFSITLISKAKCQDAVQMFNSQLSNLWLKTKSISGSQKSMYMVVKPVSNASGVKVAYQAEIYKTGTDAPIETTVLEGNPQRSKKCRVSIQYREEGTDENAFKAIETFTIKFDKSTGEVLEGAGYYRFLDTSGNPVATVHLNKVTGSHSIGKDKDETEESSEEAE